MEHVRDRIAALVIFAVAAGAWWMSQAYPANARMVPQLLTVAMMVLSAIMFARTFVPALQSRERTKFFANGRYLLVSCAMILGYIALSDLLGFFTTTALFVASLCAVLGFRRWGMIAISTVLFLISVYVVFVVIFDRQLPPEFFMAR